MINKDIKTTYMYIVYKKKTTLNQFNNLLGHKVAP